MTHSNCGETQAFTQLKMKNKQMKRKSGNKKNIFVQTTHYFLFFKIIILSVGTDCIHKVYKHLFTESQMKNKKQCFLLKPNHNRSQRPKKNRKFTYIFLFIVIWQWLLIQYLGFLYICEILNICKELVYFLSYQQFLL